jgi:hypothetical protein
VEKEKLSAREAALIAQARREAEALKRAPATAPLAAPPGEGQARLPEKPDPAERMAKLMAEERAETARRKKKMRSYGLLISAAILAAFALWLMRVFSRRR